MTKTTPPGRMAREPAAQPPVSRVPRPVPPVLARALSMGPDRMPRCSDPHSLLAPVPPQAPPPQRVSLPLLLMVLKTPGPLPHQPQLPKVAGCAIAKAC